MSSAWDLCSLLLLCTSKLLSHRLFVWTSTQNGHIIYTHRLLINRRAQLPCFREGDAEFSDTASVRWTHRGFNITSSHSPFVSADWDAHGNLMIHSILPRQINLWCHNIDKLFVHRLEFSEAAFTQTIFAVDMRAQIITNLSKSYQEFLYSQTSNCRVQVTGGGLGVLKDAAGVDLTKDVFQKKIVMETVEHICEDNLDCIGFSLDFFECSVSMVDNTAYYSLDFSILHSMNDLVENSSTGVNHLEDINNASYAMHNITSS